tara:strand:- start:911 stop:1363 length:453 start_codon:yes stop_codon:yes gene_type:complete
MRNENQPSTDIDSMGRLALAVAIAAERCHPSTRKTLLEACDALEEEFDALKAELAAVRDCFRAVEYISDYQRGQWEALNKKLARVKASTVAEEITNWAEANYSKSHEASAVVEGCYDNAELEAFGSLAAFKEHAGIRDDYRADIVATGGE